MENKEPELIDVEIELNDEHLEYLKRNNLDLNELIRKMVDGLIEEDNIIDTGEISDGYHTFDELYYHRMVLFSVICNQNRDNSWKSWLHADGTMYEDYFIVGITTPEGDYTYHYHKDYWELFNVLEISRAHVWDGHQPGDIGRLNSLMI